MPPTNLLANFFAFIEDRSTAKHYPFLLALFLMLGSWILVYPVFPLLESGNEAWQVIQLKSQDLTHALAHIDPESNESKKVFRLTVPILMRVFHLTPAMVIGLQVILGYLMYVVCYKATFRISKDAVQATLLTAGIACLYLGRSAYVDVNGCWFDTYSYFFLILAIYLRNPWAIFLCATAAAWTDERGFIALSVVCLFHYFEPHHFREKLRFRQVFRLNKNTISVLLAMALYLSVRAFMSYRFDMHTPTGGANYTLLAQTLKYAPIGLWTFFEGFWMLYLLCFIYLFHQKDYYRFLLYAAPLLVLTTVSLCVLDITRSGTYLTPMIFVALLCLKQYHPQKQLRFLLFIAFIVSFLFPATFVMVISDDIWVRTSTDLLGRIVEYLLGGGS